MVVNEFFIVRTVSGKSPLRVVVDGAPPCLWCGKPVLEPSMDGPLVCCACDCGYNEDGTKWTAQDYQERRTHFAREIERYVAEAHARGEE